MPVLTIFNGLYSNARGIIQELDKGSGYTIVTDKEIIEKTALTYKLKQATLLKAVRGKQIAFNDFTHEKEKCIACLRMVAARYLEQDNLIIHGILGHLIPENISHVIRILVMTNKATRIENAMASTRGSRQNVIKAINMSDQASILSSLTILGKKAFDESIYDIVIPTDKFNTTEAAALIVKHVKHLDTIPEGLIQKEKDNSKLSAEIAVQLAPLGSRLSVESDDGDVIVTIDRNVMLLSKFKQKITTIVKNINKVKSVTIKLGKNYYSSPIVRKINVDTPARLLLVDDEKEFVQTLSERLKMRQFSSEIAYGGKQALEITDTDETDVMVLDLKMPGIDGFEVLKKIKKTKPHIEVIILTGHGSKSDEKRCMELGAFAYLEKPTDIELLTETMNRAYKKVNENKKSTG